MGSDDESNDSRRKSRKMSDGDDKSRSKSRSRSRSRSRGGGGGGGRLTKVVDIAKDDAAFVLGRGGATKRKIARVSGADIELDEHALTITLNGTESQCDPVWKHCVDLRGPPRHRTDAVTATTSRRWRRISTPSSSHRVDGMGRPKFDFHTGATMPSTTSTLLNNKE
jgi:hypothetical protein